MRLEIRGVWNRRGMILRGEKMTTPMSFSALDRRGESGKLLRFSIAHPWAIILIKGSTAARTRLYQIGITLGWLEIQMQYDVWGRRANKWSPFEKGVNYEEFRSLQECPIPDEVFRRAKGLE